MKENAETTKLRVVYGASAKSEEVSLNECFEKGPPLQNMLWDVRAKDHLSCALTSKGPSRTFV